MGGKEETFNAVKPILESLSVSLRYIGDTGAAAQVKALVNMVMNINTAGLAEGLGLGAALGLDLSVLQEVFSQTGANSRFWKQMVRICKTVIMNVTFLRLMPPRILE